MSKHSHLLNCFYTFDTTTDIKTIVKELSVRFGIHHFSYVKRYEDYSHILLSSSPEWQEYYYTNELFRISDLEYPASYYKPGFALWNTFQGQEIFKASKAFGIDHGIVFIKPGNGYCEFFHFATTPENSKILNFYLNHIDLLHQFNNHFKQVAASIIQKGETQRIILPHDYISQKQSPNENWHFNQQLLMAFLKKDEETMSALLPRLAKRERECCYYVVQAMTSKQIAQQLNISYRTVEKHIESIKAKLSCKSRSELIALLNKLLNPY